MDPRFRIEAIRSKKITKSAKGEECDYRSELCTHNPETTVWVHLDRAVCGKAGKRKSDDLYGFYGCNMCHGVYDGSIKTDLTKEFREEMATEAHHRSLMKLIRKGIVIVL